MAEAVGRFFDMGRAAARLDDEALKARRRWSLGRAHWVKSNLGQPAGRDFLGRLGSLRGGQTRSKFVKQKTTIQQARG